MSSDTSPQSASLKFIAPPLLLSIALAGHAGTAAGASCEGLKSLALPDTTIDTAQLIPAGAFTPPTPARGRAGCPSFADLPAFCRVSAAVKRPGDTDVKIEIWMPATGWNGDFRPAASGFGGG